jgi:hypothetical protein
MILLLLMRRFTAFKGSLYLLTRGAPWVILAENDYDTAVCMELP